MPVVSDAVTIMDVTSSFMGATIGQVPNLGIRVGQSEGVGISLRPWVFPACSNRGAATTARSISLWACRIPELT